MTESDWIPLVPSALMQVGEVEQFFINDRDLAVWRSEQGQVQIWENRCPHRSVRLSLGRVQGESLICAYHGWQFAAESGHCQRIPAQPDQRAPKSLCTKAYAVQEQLGMVWFKADTTSPLSATNVMTTEAWRYAGSVAIFSTLLDAQYYLQQLGFNHLAQQNALVWEHPLQMALRIYLTPSKADMITVHAMLLQDEAPHERHPLLMQMRQYLEQEQHEYA